MPAPATSENSDATRARPSFPASWARRTASAFEPRPEPRMTTRMRARGLCRAGRPDAADELRRAEAGLEREKSNLRADRVECGLLCGGQGRERVVPRLAVDVGLESQDLPGEPLSPEDNDAVHRAQPLEH